MQLLSDIVPVDVLKPDGSKRKKRPETWGKEFIAFLKKQGWTEVDNNTKITDKDVLSAVKTLKRADDNYDLDLNEILINPFCKDIIVRSDYQGVQVTPAHVITREGTDYQTLSITKELAPNIKFDEPNGLLIIGDSVAFRVKY